MTPVLLLFFHVRKRKNVNYLELKAFSDPTLNFLCSLASTRSPSYNLTFWGLSGITLAALLIPIAVGMLVKNKWPSKAKKILKVGNFHLFFPPVTKKWCNAEERRASGRHLFSMWWRDLLGPVSLRVWTGFVFRQVGSIVGFLLIIIIAVIGGVLYQSSWTIAPSLWIIGAMYPFIGFGLGFFMARFVGQPWHRWASG